MNGKYLKQITYPNINAKEVGQHVTTTHQAYQTNVAISYHC